MPVLCCHCSRECAGLFNYQDFKTGAVYCTPACREAGPGERATVVEWDGRVSIIPPGKPHCAIVSCQKPLGDLALHCEGSPYFFCSQPCADAAEMDRLALWCTLDGKPVGATVFDDLRVARDWLDRYHSMPCAVCQSPVEDPTLYVDGQHRFHCSPLCRETNRANDGHALAQSCAERVAQLEDLLTGSVETNAALNGQLAQVVEQLATSDAALADADNDLEAARARFADTICRLSADLDMERQRHELTQKRHERTCAHFDNCREERDTLRRDRDRLKELADRRLEERNVWKEDSDSVATAYFRLRRLCYATAFAGPLLGGLVGVATLYRYTLLPWLTTHAPSSGTWCLLAVGLACLLVGRRWRRAVVERGEVDPHWRREERIPDWTPPVEVVVSCPADPLRDKLAAKIEGLTDEECSPEECSPIAVRDCPLNRFEVRDACDHIGHFACNLCGWHRVKPSMCPMDRRCFFCDQRGVTWHGDPTEGYVPWCALSDCEGLTD